VRSDPARIARGTPLVDDRLLLELLNELHTAGDVQAAEARQSFFQRLLDGVTGRDRRRARFIHANVVGVQEKTVAWLTDVTRRQAVSALVVAEVCDETRKVRDRFDATHALGERTADKVAELSKVVAETIGVVSDHERRIERLEAKDHLEDSVRRWRRSKNSGELPWLVAGILLAREVAVGPAGDYAYHVPDSGMAERLVDDMLHDPPRPWFEGTRSLAKVMAETRRSLPTEDHRLMVAELLGVGVPEPFANIRGTFTASVATSMELPVGSVDDAARTALMRHSDSGTDFLPESLPIEQLVRRIVEEQFTEAHRRRDRLDRGASGE
jgi:hypothetical protein